MAASGHAPGEAVTGVTISFTVLAFMATAMRLYTRIGIVRNVGLDDVVITIALALTIVLTITMCQQVRYGMGRHADTLTPNDNEMSLVWFWASVWVYYLALCFAKLSILLQYLRIFPERRFRMGCFTLIGIIVGWTFWAFFSALFACWPIQSFWDNSIEGTCLNRLAVWFSNAAVNIITDTCTAVLPLPVLKSLNLPKRQKIVLMVVFGLGGVTCIISILRLSALYAISKSSDVSWDNPLAAIWSSLEVNVGILCSCIPTLKGCITRYFPTLFSSSSYGASNNMRPSTFELAGNHGKSHASCTATVDRDEREGKRSGRFSRLGKRLAGGSNGVEIKEVDKEEGGSESGSSGRDVARSPASGGIQITTIVEQEEERKERDRESGRHESESVRGLIPAQPYEGT